MSKMANEQLRKPNLKRQFSFIETVPNDLLKVSVTKETLEKIPRVDFNLAENCSCTECLSANKINNDVKVMCKLFLD
jgi:hypothetical protein